MQEIIIQVMNQFGYFGVAFLIMIENIFPPIPSEVILTFGGFMTTYSELGIYRHDYRSHYWFCAWCIDTLLRRSSFKR